jgi:hypothetical protein
LAHLQALLRRFADWQEQHGSTFPFDPDAATAAE